MQLITAASFPTIISNKFEPSSFTFFEPPEAGEKLIPVDAQRTKLIRVYEAITLVISEQ